MDYYERVTYTLIHGGTRRTGKSATITLRIVRVTDHYVYDWDSGTFKAFTDGSLGTIDKPATGEVHATKDPGAYYWDIGSGSAPTGVLPAAFSVDGLYRFEISESTLGHEVSWGASLLGQRLAEVYAARWLKGDKVLTEGATGNFVVKEEDGATALMTKNIQDKSGGSIELSPGVPSKEITAA